MNENKRTGIPFFILSVVILAAVFGLGFYFNSEKEPQDEPIDYGGQSIVVRDVVGVYGTPTASTTAAVQLNAGNDLLAVATSTATTTLFQNTDMVLVTITQPEASTTNSFYWHITASNDWEACNAIGTSTTDVAYVAAYPLKTDIHWYDLIAADVTASGLDNYGNIDIASTEDVNASSTSFLLTDMNWDCLKTEYRGASTTVLMQIREKVLDNPY